MTEQIITDSYSFLLNNKRFDLFIKFLFLEKRNLNPSFFKTLYLEHLKAFNNFNEDYGRKRGKVDFLNDFFLIKSSIERDGFDPKHGFIPINLENQIIDGAHRLASCAYLNQSFIAEQRDCHVDYDYSFFQKRNFPTYLADYVAMEYVKHNPHAHIMELHAVNDIKFDEKVEQILSKYGFVYYKKNVYLSYNGYVSLKKINYGTEFWNQDTFIGSFDNDFQGAKDHATRSFGKNPLRVYVFVCDELDKVLEAKKEIRSIFNIGNHSVHINDTHAEAIYLSELLFNDNSIHFFNNSSYNLNQSVISESIDKFKMDLNENNINCDDVCLVGSLPLALYDLRETNDIDFVTLLDNIDEFDFSSVDLHKDYHYFENDISDIIYNPQYYFYYKGLKIITLDTLYKYKKNRNEYPKDMNDCLLIESFNSNGFALRNRIRWRKIRIELKLFCKHPLKYCFYKIKSSLAKIKCLRQLWIKIREFKNK